jgi:hypothetical protein
MVELPIREPEQIQQDCVRKLRQVEMDGMFAAILGYFLHEGWTQPRIANLRFSRKHCLFARVEGQASFNTFLAKEAELIWNVHEVAKAAGLGGDELGYLLGKIAEIKRPKNID